MRKSPRALVDVPVYLDAYGKTVMGRIANLGLCGAYINLEPLPLVNSERASSRFLIIPVLLLLVIACARMQGALDRLSARGKNWKWLPVAAFLIAAFEIVNHSVRWSVTLFERTDILYPYPVDVRIVAAPATAYETVFKLSLVVSCATAAVLAVILVSRKAAHRDYE